LRSIWTSDMFLLHRGKLSSNQARLLLRHTTCHCSCMHHSHCTTDTTCTYSTPGGSQIEVVTVIRVGGEHPDVFVRDQPKLTLRPDSPIGSSLETDLHMTRRIFRIRMVNGVRAVVWNSIQCGGHPMTRATQFGKASF
jgi:hypothetical protein